MGWLPPKINVQIFKIRLWNRLIKMHPDRLIRSIFEWDWLLRKDNWLSEILSIFSTLQSQNNFHEQNLYELNQAEQHLCNLYDDEWNVSVASLPKLRTYRTF